MTSYCSTIPNQTQQTFRIKSKTSFLGKKGHRRGLFITVASPFFFFLLLVLLCIEGKVPRKFVGTAWRFGLEYPDKALSGREGLAVLLEEETAAKNDPMPTARFYLKIHAYAGSDCP